MRKPNLIQTALFAATGLILISLLAYQIPYIHSRLSWRLDRALTFLHGVVSPAGPVPTPLPRATQDSAVETLPSPTPTLAYTPTPTASPTPGPTATERPSPTPIPSTVALTAPEWEQQDWNNCGPTTLAMYLRYYGWQGTQFDISDVLKPKREDRNVNVEELVYWVRNYAGWLRTEFRVGGNPDRLKTLLAAGFPVMIEETFILDAPYWPNDDLWAAHYFLLTGYDDASQTFTGQDSFHGANQKISYTQLDEYWQPFNRVYLLVYLPEQEETLKGILGEDWDVDVNRRKALETAQAETESDPQNAYTWFNLGTNQVYFEDYEEAAQSYDQARTLGLPQRMLRYQFGPFFAYFHSLRNDDLLALTEYALDRTANSEEALLWHGWGLYRSGDTNGAIQDFNAALEANPNYSDAQYALDYVRSNP